MRAAVTESPSSIRPFDRAISSACPGLSAFTQIGPRLSPVLVVTFTQKTATPVLRLAFTLRNYFTAVCTCDDMAGGRAPSQSNVSSFLVGTSANMANAAQNAPRISIETSAPGSKKTANWLRSLLGARSEGLTATRQTSFDVSGCAPRAVFLHRARSRITHVVFSFLNPDQLRNKAD